MIKTLIFNLGLHRTLLFISLIEIIITILMYITFDVNLYSSTTLFILSLFMSAILILLIFSILILLRKGYSIEVIQKNWDVRNGSCDIRSSSCVYAIQFKYLTMSRYLLPIFFYNRTLAYLYYNNKFLINKQFVENLAKLLTSLYFVYLSVFDLNYAIIFFIPTFIEPILFLFYNFFFKGKYIAFFLSIMTIIISFIKLYFTVSEFKHLIVLLRSKNNFIIVEDGIQRIINKIQSRLNELNIITFFKLLFLK